MSSKKRERITNLEPFTPFESDSTSPSSSSSSSSSSKERRTKNQQIQHELIPSDIRSHILEQAKLPNEEILKENNDNSNVFQSLHNNPKDNYDDDDDDIDDFQGFPDNSGEFHFEEDIKEAEKLLEDVLFSTETIVERIKDVQISSGVESFPNLDASSVELYKGLGKFLSQYTAGQMPKAFKHIPSLQFWKQFLFLTEPEKWSPNAMYQATRIFASNMRVKKVEIFYKLVLLPRLREDIKKNKTLHFALYRSLKKALYKPAAFNKGILFPLCESRTCNLREAAIVGSIIKKISIPFHHSSVALLKLASMEYYSIISYFIKLLIEKKYALPYRVLNALVDHFMKFNAESGVMPVIWHLSLLAFVQRYKNELTKEDKENLNNLLQKQKHKSITAEILRELNNSRNRGEKEVNKTIQEDRFDIPDVRMEED